MKLNIILSTLSLIQLCKGYEALKDYLGKSDFKVGAAINSEYFNIEEYVEAASNFNMVVAENGCKLSGIQRKQGIYDFKDCDLHYEFAKEHNMELRGHCLIWHSHQPKWFQEITSPEVMNKTIVEHITNVLNHYKGKIKVWDVVNEAISDDSTKDEIIFNDSFIYKALPNFVDIAFQTARSVDPDVKLFYNDYNNEGMVEKTYAVYNFVKDLVDRGIPIDGIGMQYHVAVLYNPYIDYLDELMGKYCNLGLEVQITEMDVKCTDKCDDPNVSNLQSNVYTAALKTCLKHSCCTAFLVWGISDKYSWIEETEKPLLFDSSFQPKPQYTALLNLLKEKLGETYTSTIEEITTESTTTSVETSTTEAIQFTEFPDSNHNNETSGSISLISFINMKSFTFYFLGYLLLYLLNF